jgi:Transposase DDE domain group 1
MQTECIAGQLEFEGFGSRRVVAAFDGGAVTSDAGALLLREADRAVRLIDRVAGCFSDGRDQTGVVHAVHTLVGQRIIGIALGYEDVNDHDGSDQKNTASARNRSLSRHLDRASTTSSPFSQPGKPTFISSLVRYPG